MSIVFLRAAVITAAALFASGDARALSFDERWKSLFAESEVTGERVSAKAEMVRRAERPTRADRHAARRHRSDRRGERRREWYKGGRKWHYVLSRRRAR